MRVAICLILTCLSSAAEPASSRYGIALDLQGFPQGAAKETLASVIKAVEAKKVDYLVAHLADPAFVDDRVKRIYAGKFAEQVADAQTRLDPSAVKLLKRFLERGKWTIDKTSAVAQLDHEPDRCVRLLQSNGRWYLEHRSDPPAK